MNEFALVLNRMLRQSGKSIQQVAELGGVDPAYARRLLGGEKLHPSAETVLKLWVGLIFDPDLAKRHPDMMEGLAELLIAAATTSANLKAVGSMR